MPPNISGVASGPSLELYAFDAWEEPLDNGMVRNNIYVVAKNVSSGWWEYKISGTCNPGQDPKPLLTTKEGFTYEPVYPLGLPSSQNLLCFSFQNIEFPPGAYIYHLGNSLDDQVYFSIIYFDLPANSTPQSIEIPFYGSNSHSDWHDTPGWQTATVKISKDYEVLSKIGGTNAIDQSYSKYSPIYHLGDAINLGDEAEVTFYEVGSSDTGVAIGALFTSLNKGYAVDIYSFQAVPYYSGALWCCSTSAYDWQYQMPLAPLTTQNLSYSFTKSPNDAMWLLITIELKEESPSEKDTFLQFVVALQ